MCGNEPRMTARDRLLSALRADDRAEERKETARMIERLPEAVRALGWSVPAMGEGGRRGRR